MQQKASVYKAQLGDGAVGRRSGAPRGLRRLKWEKPGTAAPVCHAAPGQEPTRDRERITARRWDLFGAWQNVVAPPAANSSRPPLPLWSKPKTD
jgi:hypothetical protein